MYGMVIFLGLSGACSLHESSHGNHFFSLLVLVNIAILGSRLAFSKGKENGFIRSKGSMAEIYKAISNFCLVVLVGFNFIGERVEVNNHFT